MTVTTRARARSALKRHDDTAHTRANARTVSTGSRLEDEVTARSRLAFYTSEDFTNQRERTLTSAEFYTTNEVAALLRTSPSTVRYWRYTGKGPDSIKPGKAVLYPRRAVDDWIDRLRAESGVLAGAGAP